jgi:hypothetical protein
MTIDEVGRSREALEADFVGESSSKKDGHDLTITRSWFAIAAKMVRKMFREIAAIALAYVAEQ